MGMETASILPAPGQLKTVLRLLNDLAGGHADATVDGSYEVTAPLWLVEKYNEAVAPAPAPVPKRRGRPKKEEVEQ